MKRLLILLPVLLLSLWLPAVSLTELQEAETMYQEGKYAESAEIYNKVLLQGQASAGLYYNLGNCYYKTGANTLAILNYERALLLNPSDKDARYNLELAQKAVVDKIVVLPELFLLRWYKDVVTYYSADQWAYISVVFFLLFLFTVGLFFYSSTVFVKKSGFVMGICMLFFMVCSGIFAMKQNSRIENREYAIVMRPSVTVKGAPDNSGTELFVVHEGLKVALVGSLGEWYNIRLADGNEGWIAKADIEKI